MLVSFPISQAEDRKHPRKWNSSYFRKEITWTIWLQKRMFPGETVETICSLLLTRRAESQFWVLHFLSDKRGNKNELTGFPAGRHTERVGLTEGRPCPDHAGGGEGSPEL